MEGACAHLFLLCGSEAEVVEDLRLQGAKGLQQGRDQPGGVRLQSGARRLTDLHQGLDTDRGDLKDSCLCGDRNQERCKLLDVT